MVKTSFVVPPVKRRYSHILRPLVCYRAFGPYQNLLVYCRVLCRKHHYCNIYYPDPSLSFINIHKINNRSTPEMFTLYKNLLLLHKLYNKNTVENERICLNLQQQFSVRGDLLKVTKTSKLKVGNNIMVNRIID